MSLEDLDEVQKEMYFRIKGNPIRFIDEELDKMNDEAFCIMYRAELLGIKDAIIKLKNKIQFLEQTEIEE